MTIKEIAAKYGVHQNTIMEYAISAATTMPSIGEKHEWSRATRRPRDYTDEEVAEIMRQKKEKTVPIYAVTPIDEKTVSVNIKGHDVLIDTDDLKIVNAHNWSVMERPHGVYFGTKIWKDGKGRTGLLHRMIMGEPAGLEVDHKNCNTLDMRKENLRICTHEENGKNTHKKKPNATGYKGVYKVSNNRYFSEIRVNMKKIHLGSFATAEEAYAAYCEAALKYHGEFARIA